VFHSARQCNNNNTRLSWFLGALATCFGMALSAQPLVVKSAHFIETKPLITQWIPSPVFLKSLSFYTDIDCSSSELYAISGLHEGDILTCDALMTAMHYVFQKNKFETIAIEKEELSGGIGLTMNITSFWTLGNVKIKGISLGRDRFRQYYLMQNGDRFDNERHVHSLTHLKETLTAQGYYGVHIASELQFDQKTKTVDVSITIDKGPHFKIGDVTVRLYMSDSPTMIDTLAQLEPTITHFCKKLYRAPYTKNFLNRRTQLLKNQLIRLGFFKVDIQLVESIHAQTSTIDCSLSIRLPSPRLLEFVFQGDTFFSAEQLLDHVLVFGSALQVLPPALLVQELQALYHQYGFEQVAITAEQKNGRLIFSIAQGERTPSQAGLAALKMPDLSLPLPSSSSESSDQMFGPTIVQQCPHFPYEYLLRELTYKEGQPFQPEHLTSSLLQLKELDIFDSIRLTPGPLVESGIRPVLLQVQKDDRCELRLHAGVGLQQMSTQFTFRSLTYVAGGVFKIKNPFEKADQLRVEADYRRGMHSVVLSYRQPWMGKIPIAWHIDGYSIQYLQPGWIEMQHNLYAIWQQGFLIGLTHKKPWYTVGLNMGFEWMETKTTGVPENRFFNISLARALNFVPFLLDHHIPYIMAEPTLILDYTDDKVNPTTGSFTMMSLKTMIPLAYRDLASYFVKLSLQQSVYIPLYPLQLLLGFRVGHIFQKNLSSIMASERFYLGGANSIRSYQTDSCPPLGMFLSTDGEKIFVPQGARSMINGNVELRLALTRRLDGAIFQDLGALSNTIFTQIKRKDILAGTGFGIRYATPIGPLRCDIAWKWHREDPSISRFAWYITFGSVF